jgi:hypothetical protein
VVVRADRDAAGHGEDVSVQRPLDGGRRRGGVVGHDRVDHDLGAGLFGEQRDREAVGLVDPARLGRRAHLQQLGAGREHVHDGAAAHRH